MKPWLMTATECSISEHLVVDEISLRGSERIKARMAAYLSGRNARRCIGNPPRRVHSLVHSIASLPFVFGLPPHLTDARVCALFRACVVGLGILQFGCSQPTDQDLIGSGKASLERRDSASAAIQFKNAVAMTPGNPEARFLLATALVQAMEFPSAFIEFKKAAELGYDLTVLEPALVSAFIDYGDDKSALRAIEEARTTDPAAKLELSALRGDIFLINGDQAKAESEYRKVLASDSLNKTARLGVSQLKMGASDLAGALEIVDRLLSEDPGLQKAHIVRANILLIRGERAAAIASFERAIQIRPMDFRVHLALVPLLLSEDKVSNAEELLRSLRGSRPLFAKYYLQSAIDSRKGDLVSGRNNIAKALELSPDEPRALFLAGTLEYQSGNYALAERHLTKTVSTSPRADRPRLLLAATYLEMGRIADATKTVLPIQAAGEIAPTVYRLRGDIALKNRRPADAASFFARALELSPDSEDLQIRHANALVATGRAKDGVNELQSYARRHKSLAVLTSLAYLQLRQKDLVGVQETAELLVQSHPASAEGFMVHAEIALAKDDRALAREMLTRASKVDPARFDPISRLVGIDLFERNTQQAVKRLEEFVGRSPRSEAAVLMLVNVLRKVPSQTERVMKLIDTSLVSNPTAVGLWLAKIEIHSRTGNRRDALAAAEAARAALPDEPRILLAVGRAQRDVGDHGKAVNTLASAAQAMPMSVAPYLGQADSLVAQENFSGAIDVLKKAIVLKPDHIGVWIALVNTQARAGLREDAIATSRRVQEQWPDQAIGYLSEAEVRAKTTDLSGAEVAIRSGLRNSSSSSLIRFLYSLLADQGDWRGAEAEMAKWASKNPRDAKTFDFVGSRALKGGQSAIAIHWLERATGVRPNDPAKLNNLAVALAPDDLARARQVIDRALSLAPQNPAVLDTSGDIYLRAGQVEKALEHFESSISISPRIAENRIGYANALIRANRHREAMEQLTTADRFARSEEVRREIMALKVSAGSRGPSEAIKGK